ncbi:MAG: rsbU [Candidatus Angelobacter sp.]|nr:rsbU [Candidatus Angelobacter sp.]
MLHLAEGDAIFLYTDGLIEAEDHEQNEFSQERVKTLLNQAHGKPLELIFESANDALKAHCTTRTQSDDITMLGCSISDPVAAIQPLLGIG